MHQPTRDQAANLMAGIATDYVNHLRKIGHECAALALQQKANQALAVLRSDESSQPVPGAQD